MSEFNRDKQLKGLHEGRRKKTREKVDLAIRKLSMSGKDINFNSVAKEAGVTKATLYNNTDIRERIEELREKQENEKQQSITKRNENNYTALIGTLNRKIEKLEKEIKSLKKENAQLREYSRKDLTELFNEL